MKLHRLTTEQKTALEGLIDATSLSGVTDAISQICSEKAVHIRDNWQDGPGSKLVRTWIAASNQFDSLEQKLNREGL